MTRIGPIDRDFGLDARRPIAENDDALARNSASSDIMGHQQRW